MFPLARLMTVFLLALTFLVTSTFTNHPQSVAIAGANNNLNNNQEQTLLYSNSKDIKSLNNVDDFVSRETQEKLLDATQIPAEKQPLVDRGNPDSKILEKIVQMFKDASEFLN